MALLNTSIILSVLHLFNDQTCIPKNLPGGMVCVCNTKCDTTSAVFPSIPNGYFFQIVSDKKGKRFVRDVRPFNATEKTERRNINIDFNITGQKILGWGGTFSDSAGKNINSLSPKTRGKLMKSYFHKDGLQLSLCRVTIGDSDFSDAHYNLDPVAGNTNLSHFKLSTQDTENKIPLIKNALKISKGKLNLFASASSAPQWMMSGQNIAQDQLLTWTNYHIKFLDEYKKNGINFWGLTTGYEPVPTSQTYPGANRVKWNAPNMNVWIAQNFGPTLRSANYNDLKLMAYDDQRSKLDWAMKGLLSQEVKKYVDGIAVHTANNDYFESKVFKKMITQYPDYFYLSTDFVADKVAPIKIGSWDVAEEYAEKIINDLNGMVTGHVDFNLALDLEGGPTHINRFGDSPIIVNSTGDEFYKQPLFYILGHFSKYIPPGSVNVFTKHNIKQMSVAAFLRPDNGVTIVILNRSRRNVHLDVLIEGTPNITCYVEKYSINTIIFWK